MRTAIAVEALKLRRSLVGIIATIAIVGGTIALLAGITAALASGNAQMLAKAGPGATRDWTGLLSSATQITAAGGLLGFGVVLAWLFAREFTDGTITGLFALPVGRGRIAIAKLIVYAMWVITVRITLAGCLVVLLLILGHGVPTAHAGGGRGRTRLPPHHARTHARKCGGARGGDEPRFPPCGSAARRARRGWPGQARP